MLIKFILTISFGFVFFAFAQTIGKISFIEGEAMVERKNKNIAVKKDFPIELKDEIITQKNSNVELIFIDDTKISIGQNSKFAVEEYQNDGIKKAKFNALGGTFKAITGQIGKISPKTFKIQTLNAAIGIRGTTIYASTSKIKDFISCIDGKITVHNDKGSIDLNAGQSTVVLNSMAPSGVIFDTQNSNHENGDFDSTQNDSPILNTTNHPTTHPNNSGGGSNISGSVTNKANINQTSNVASGASARASVGSVSVE